jgi:hypothetical protein
MSCVLAFYLASLGEIACFEVCTPNAYRRMWAPSHNETRTKAFQEPVVCFHVQPACYSVRFRDSRTKTAANLPLPRQDINSATATMYTSTAPEYIFYALCRRKTMLWRVRWLLTRVPAVHANHAPEYDHACTAPQRPKRSRTDSSRSVSIA